jgi:hypothetical protein
MFGLKNYPQSQQEQSSPTDYAFDKAAAVEHHLKKQKQRRARQLVNMLLIAVVVLGLATIYSQYRIYVLTSLVQVQVKTNPEVPQTTEQVLAAVKRHIVLPDGTPQVATVKDPTKLAGTQPFFKNVAAGDIVIVYDQAIYLYRPLSDIIVAVGDLSGATGTKK